MIAWPAPAICIDREVEAEDDMTPTAPDWMFKLFRQNGRDPMTVVAG